MSPRKALAHVLPRALAAAAASAILLGSAVQAKTNVTEHLDSNGRVTRVADVAYGDLDLTREAGVQTLKSRINNAVRTVCGPSSRGTVADDMDYRACISEARSTGKQAMVTLIARAETGERFAANESMSVAN